MYSHQAPLSLYPCYSNYQSIFEDIYIYMRILVFYTWIDFIYFIKSDNN